MGVVQFVLAAATAVGGMGMAAGGTAAALVAVEVTGHPATAGLPLGALVVGSALGALLIARVTRQTSRVTGLVAGYAIGAAGAAVVVAATMTANFGLVLAGSAAMGVANAALYLTRYAAADAVPEASRGRALGVVLAGAAVGAVVSFNLMGPSGDLASWLGLSRVTGLYLVAVVAFPVAAAMLALLGRRMRRPVVADARTDEVRAPHAAYTVSARGALLVLAVTNLVMVAVMAIAPLHLVAHGHDLDVVGMAVSVHVLCMLAPAPLAGWLADRAGTRAVAGLGATLMALAGIAGALADASNTVVFTVVLAVLGLGWCAGVVAGSTMLAASLPEPERPRAEGIGEVAMGLAAGAGAPLAGVVISFGGFPTLTIAAAGVSGLVLLGGRWAVDQPQPESAQVGAQPTPARSPVDAAAAGRIGRDR